jgi:hypothetical protein
MAFLRLIKKVTPATSVVLITGAKLGLLPQVEKNRSFGVEFMGVLRRKAGEFGSFGRFQPKIMGVWVFFVGVWVRVSDIYGSFLAYSSIVVRAICR